MAASGAYFDDALLGADGTGQPRAVDTYGDALAHTLTGAEEWDRVALPQLPAPPGGDERAARALVEADPLPPVPGPGRPARTPDRRWRALQAAPPMPAPPMPAPPMPWWPATGWPATGWAGTPGAQVPGWPAPPRPLPPPGSGSPHARHVSVAGALAVLATVLLLVLGGYLLLR